ncbi:hypothetical protein BV25DRAFT_716063 [Artomyces pyxidatus]|uniref:Uncharacterized protein n=1 Tax=Artomyces pyxidatus TaxID=48021 RepID=A0ACB8T0P5_9AGAM|nr:hypothetical protein BV25DRAFT_716063 [Artomyces pyxidatus]
MSALACKQDQNGRGVSRSVRFCEVFFVRASALVLVLLRLAVFDRALICFARSALPCRVRPRCFEFVLSALLRCLLFPGRSVPLLLVPPPPPSPSSNFLYRTASSSSRNHRNSKRYPE